MTRQLTLLTWPDYINPVTLEQFESEFGVKINPEIVPSAVELVERMKSEGPAPDVLCPPDYAVRELGAEGHLAALDHEKLSNFKHLEKRFQFGRPHDTQSRLSIIKDWGTTGFIYRTDMIYEEPKSWAEFWQLTEKFSGRVTVFDSPGEVIGAALKMRGHSYNASSPACLAGARHDLLDRSRPPLLCRHGGEGNDRRFRRAGLRTCAGRRRPSLTGGRRRASDFNRGWIQMSEAERADAGRHRDGEDSSPRCSTRTSSARSRSRTMAAASS